MVVPCSSAAARIAPLASVAGRTTFPFFKSFATVSMKQHCAVVAPFSVRRFSR